MDVKWTETRGVFKEQGVNLDWTNLYALLFLARRASCEPCFESTPGSQQFCGELSPPVIERQIAAGLAQPSNLAAVGNDLSVSAAGLLPPFVLAPQSHPRTTAPTKRRDRGTVTSALRA